jgi:TATA-box binding protein (TBP) (component of TFIID and TFIIIB)
MNIKLPLQENWQSFTLPMFTLEQTGWKRSKISYQLYLQQRGSVKREKKKFNTFLIFHSGKIIMSGMHEDSMKDDFLFFSTFLKENQNLIEEIIAD